MHNRHRSNFFMRGFVVLLVAFIVVSIIDIQVRLSSLSSRKDALRDEVIAVTDDIAELQMQLEQAKEMTDEYIARVAIEKLGYRYKDDMVFYNDIAN